MLTVIARIEARPEFAACLKQAMLALLAPTRAEPGCLAYELLESSDDPALIALGALPAAPPTPDRPSSPPPKANWPPTAMRAGDRSWSMLMLSFVLYSLPGTMAPPGPARPPI